MTGDGDRANMVELSALEGQAYCGPTVVPGSANPCTQSCPQLLPHMLLTQPAVPPSIFLLLLSRVSCPADTLGIPVRHWLFASLPITLPLGSLPVPK